MSEHITEIHEGDLDVSDEVTVQGVVSRNVTVRDGGVLDLDGVVGGRIDVLNGGEARVSGVCSGAVHVHEGGRLHLTGVVVGDIRAEGRVLLAVGAHVAGRVVTAEGSWKTATGSKSYRIDDDTPRFILGANGSLSPA